MIGCIIYIYTVIMNILDNDIDDCLDNYTDFVPKIIINNSGPIYGIIMIYFKILYIMVILKMVFDPFNP